MLTRIRLEASAKTSEEVVDVLSDAADALRAMYGGEWEDVDNQDEVPYLQTTKNGWWGRLTLRRKDAEPDSVH